MVLSIASYAYEKWGHAAPAEFGLSSPFWHLAARQNATYRNIFQAPGISLKMLAYERKSRLLKTRHTKAHNAGHQIFNIMKKKNNRRRVERSANQR